MAHIRLRINQKEYEIEGSEEFIARMEPKLTEFLEKYLNEHIWTNAPALPEDSTGKQAPTPVADDEYIKSFLERYNQFNNLMAGAK